MCNLYTYKLLHDEIRGQMHNYKLIGTEWAEQFEKEMQGNNDEPLVYPNYLAPVAIDRDSVRTKEDVERWLTGTLDEALELQRPADDAAIVIRKEKVAA